MNNSIYLCQEAKEVDTIKYKLKGQTKGEILLIAVILARSISFVITKLGLESIDVFTLLGYRFLIAFIFLLPFGWQRFKHISGQTILRGFILGVAFFTVMAAEVSGLRTTSASTTAFLENTAIIFVPIFEAVLLRRFPKPIVIISALLTLLGVGFLTLKGGAISFTFGELLCMVAAVSYAISIILTDRLSKKDDPLVLGILQVGFMGLFSIIAAFIYETPTVPGSFNQWGIIISLAIVCTVFGFTLQPLAQSKTTAERAGLFCAVSPLSTSIIAFIFLGEELGMLGVIGIVFIFIGLLLINLMNFNIKEGDDNEKLKDRKIFET